MSPDTWATDSLSISATLRRTRTMLNALCGLGSISWRRSVSSCFRPGSRCVGIATGVVVVGDTVGEESAQEQVVVGETPNLAARLQSVVAPNTTLIAASTLRLLGDVFVCERLEPFELKGFFEPVVAWRVLGERVAESRFAATRSKELTRFVGRQNELHRLYTLWKQAKGGKGQVAL